MHGAQFDVTRFPIDLGTDVQMEGQGLRPEFSFDGENQRRLIHAALFGQHPHPEGVWQDAGFETADGLAHPVFQQARIKSRHCRSGQIADAKIKHGNGGFRVIVQLAH